MLCNIVIGMRPKKLNKRPTGIKKSVAKREINMNSRSVRTVIMSAEKKIK